MARINVDDSIYKDVRFFELTVKLKNLDTAIGALVRAWALAQKWWLTEFKTIPIDEWNKQKIDNSLIETGLAQVVGDRIRMRGSEDQFAWLTQKSEAGRMGGLKRPPSNAKHSLSDAKRPPSNAKRTKASSSFSISSSFSPSISDSISNKETTLLFSKEKSPKTLGAICFESYSDAYREKYGATPIRNKKINSLFKQLSERLGSEAPEVAKFYIEHSDFFYAKSGHAVDLLVRDAEKLRTEWATGNKITSSMARSAENKDHYLEQMKRVDRGEA